MGFEIGQRDLTERNVELKAISKIENLSFAIVRSYMKAAKSADGLLLNFATRPLTIKRVGREAGFSPS